MTDITPEIVFLRYYNRRRREGGPGVPNFEWQQFSTDLAEAGFEIVAKQAAKPKHSPLPEAAAKECETCLGGGWVAHVAGKGLQPLHWMACPKCRNPDDKPMPTGTDGYFP